jgi:hypothetical protein
MQKIEELRKELQKLETLEKELKRLKLAEQSKRWNEASKESSNYDYRVSKYARRIWLEKELTEGCYVERRIKPSIVKSLGLETLPENKQWNGMFYYRTEENILMYSGGGWHTLKAPKLCNDEEWEGLQKGDIPEKFKI